MKREKYNFIAKVPLRKRMGMLKRAGLESGKTLLDYGCGNGHFVRYAREHGVHAEGYDPYSQEFGDASVLDCSYDFVTAQDVLEHVDDPRALVDGLKNYVPPVAVWPSARPTRMRLTSTTRLTTSGLCTSRTTAIFPRLQNYRGRFWRGAGR
jgi:2-polyprenyl-3-methyl-5-hydroxy-6-metoxy-1,4-benzoquinol methylase